MRLLDSVNNNIIENCVQNILLMIVSCVIDEEVILFPDPRIALIWACKLFKLDGSTVARSIWVDKKKILFFILFNYFCS